MNDGVVYFAMCADAMAVKIGYSCQPRARLRQLQLACPLPIGFIGTFRGSRELERALHERLSESRLRGEWFRLNGAVLDACDGLWASGTWTRAA